MHYQMNAGSATHAETAHTNAHTGHEAITLAQKAALYYLAFGLIDAILAIIFTDFGIYQLIVRGLLLGIPAFTLQVKENLTALAVLIAVCALSTIAMLAVSLQGGGLMAILMTLTNLAFCVIFTRAFFKVRKQRGGSFNVR